MSIEKKERLENDSSTEYQKRHAIEVGEDMDNTQLTEEQINQLDKYGIIGGKILEPVDIEELRYVWNPTESIVILLDLKFTIKPHQLVDLKRFFKDEELAKSKSLQIAVNAMKDLKLVKLQDMKPEDLEKVVPFLVKLEERTESVPDGGTKINLNIDRHNNPFFARLWVEEEKIMKLNKSKRVPNDPDEILLHTMEGIQQ